MDHSVVVAAVEYRQIRNQTLVADRNLDRTAPAAEAVVYLQNYLMAAACSLQEPAMEVVANQTMSPLIPIHFPP